MCFSPTPFPFENLWLREPILFEMVIANWQSTGSLLLLDRIHSYINAIVRWGCDFMSQFKRRITWLKNELSHAQLNHNVQTTTYYSSLWTELNTLLLKEKVFWKQRSKLFWLKEEDANTKFFHSYASHRRRINRISWLQDASGVWQYNSTIVHDLILQYFNQLFLSDIGDSHYVVWCVQTWVTTEDNLSLLAPYSADEFKHVLSQMHSDKASGPYRLNLGFYHKFLSLLGLDITV